MSACFLIAGIGIRSFIGIPLEIVWGAGIVGITVMALGWRHGNKHVAYSAFFLLIFLIGMVRVEYAYRTIADLSAMMDTHATVMGVIETEPLVSEQAQSFTLDVQELNDRRMRRPAHIFIRLRKFPLYQRGDVLRVQGVLQPARFDGYISAAFMFPKEEKIGAQGVPLFWRVLDGAKFAFDSSLDAALPEPHASFMKGLLLGERSSMPASLIEKFKQTGTSHIVALSGYNITLVGAFFVDCLLLLTIPYRLTFWIGSTAIILFVFLTGASASLVRAAIMGILLLIAQHEGRQYHMTAALVCAGMIMVFVHPYILRFDIGFQLSFLATLGLVYMARPVKRVIARIERPIIIFLRGKKMPLEKEGRVHGTIKKMATQTIAAQLAVLPLLVFLFGGVSVITPITNIFVLAAVPATMALGFLTGFLGLLLSPLGMVCGWFAWVFLEYELMVIDLFSRIPFSVVSVSSFGRALIIGMYAIVAFFWWRHARKAAMIESNEEL